ncbi:Hypp6379 [Branchiostoma lanceolatum]|uniref:Hypp6379 protein n=1 Tax=Branchiostoma lanceolatum TaxID=7740 RepID=A0A8J9YTV1_BRALA|nr:Hypp6379 [Branchiostoma lanceolatum]
MTTPACSVRSLQDGDSGDKSSQKCKKLKARCLGRYVQLHNASSGFNGGIRSVFRRQIGADDWHGGVWCGLEFIGDGCCGRRSPLRCCHGSPAVAEVQGRRHLEVELAWTRTTYTRTNLLASGEVRQSGAERCGNGMLVQSAAWDYRGKYASLGLWSGTRRPGADPVG